MWWTLLACKTPADPVAPGDDDSTVPHTADTGLGTPNPTADTGTPDDTAAPPCGPLVAAPLSQVERDLRTSQDFDFDAQGHLVYADTPSPDVIGVDDTGRRQILSPAGAGVIADARGLQVQSTGKILVTHLSEGRIIEVDPTTGGRQDFLVGLAAPNALEIGDGDTVYFTETGWYTGEAARVSRFDPDTMSAPEVLYEGFNYPNGLTLSPDQQTLYVADNLNGIFRLVRDAATDTWAFGGQLFAPVALEAYDALETDVCGNLYVAEFHSGRVYRYDPTTEEVVLLVELRDPRAYQWTAMRWGSNRGGWRRDTLYVTSRSKLFALELGIDGRNQPVDLVP